MDQRLWDFVDGTGTWVARTYGMPKMAGRVLGYLLVCDPAEQTAAELAEELEASKGAISGATGMLVRAKLIERLRVRGERSDRFRLRAEAWAEQLADQTTTRETRQLFQRGLDALEGSPPSRLARLRECDALFAWLEVRLPRLWDEWNEHRRSQAEHPEPTGGEL